MPIDVRLALRAALNGLVFVVPAAIAGAVLADDDGDLAAGPAIGIVTSLVRGEELNPLTWVATALVAAVAGCAGGLLARVERASTPGSD